MAVSYQSHPAHMPIDPHATGIPIPMPHDVEAPDAGEHRGEAPENRVVRQEAPDAGEGRTNILESDFTQGRSQS